MLEKINLFPKIEAIWEKRVRLWRWAQIGSIVGLILYFVLLSSLLSYFLVLTRNDESLRQQIVTYEERAKRLQPVESKQVFLKSKLKDLYQILKFEEKPEEVLRDLEALALGDIEFLTINYQDGSLNLDGEARDVLVLDEFVKNLEDKGKALFSQAEFEEVEKTEEGNYEFSLLLKR